MQERTDTLTVESLAAYSTWSDARLLLRALQELPFSARAELDEALLERRISRIDELTLAEVESRVDAVWDTLLGRLNLWRGDLAQRLHEEVCLKADYCNNRESQDFAFWSDLIVIIAGILGDLGLLALSLVLIRRLLDQLCGCKS
jgi:hypothetical protein